MKEEEEEARDPAKEEDSWLPERAARDAARRAKRILVSMALMARVGPADEVTSAWSCDEAEGATAPSDLVRRMLRSMVDPGREVVCAAPWISCVVAGGAPSISCGDVFQSASALSTTVLDPSSTMVETKAVAVSNQFPPSSSGSGGGAASWRRPVEEGCAGVAGWRRPAAADFGI